MIVHQHVPMDGQFKPLDQFLHSLQEPSAIFVVSKHRLPLIAARRDVVPPARHIHSQGSRHVVDVNPARNSASIQLLQCLDVTPLPVQLLQCLDVTPLPVPLP